MKNILIKGLAISSLFAMNLRAQEAEQAQPTEEAAQTEQAQKQAEPEPANKIHNLAYMIYPSQEVLTAPRNAALRFMVRADFKPAAQKIEILQESDVYRKVVAEYQAVSLVFRKIERDAAGNLTSQVRPLTAVLYTESDGQNYFIASTMAEGPLYWMPDNRVEPRVNPIHPKFRTPSKIITVKEEPEGEYIWGFLDPNSPTKILGNGLGSFKILPKVVVPTRAAVPVKPAQ